MNITDSWRHQRTWQAIQVLRGLGFHVICGSEYFSVAKGNNEHNEIWFNAESLEELLAFIRGIEAGTKVKITRKRFSEVEDEVIMKTDEEFGR